MIRMIILFGLLLASVYLGLWLRHDPSYVFIATHHWTIESTLWVTLIVLALFTLTIHCLLVLGKHLMHFPTYWQQWRHKRLLYKAREKTKRGLIEFNEGHWRAAKKHLIAAAPNTDIPLINYLTAAQAAEALGDQVLRDHCLQQARTSNPEATIAIGLVQAQFQLDNQHWEQASSTLQQLQTLAPDHPYIVKLLLRLHQHQGNWQALVSMLPNIKSAKLFSERELHLLKQSIYCHVIQQLVETHPLPDLKQWMSNLPKNLKYDPQICYHYCRFLLAHHDDTLAEALLKQCLERQLDDKLLDLYGHINADTIRVPFIESLLHRHEDSAALNLCLGRIYGAKKLWGTAKEYLEKSIQLNPCPQAYYELGQLCEALGNQRSACNAYEQGLAHIIQPFS